MKNVIYVSLTLMVIFLCWVPVKSQINCSGGIYGCGAPNGTALAPAITFANDPKTGLFLNGVNDMRLVANQQQVAVFNSGNLNMSKQATIPDGSLGGPGLVFLSDTTDGLYKIGTGALGFSGTIQALAIGVNTVAGTTGTFTNGNFTLSSNGNIVDAGTFSGPINIVGTATNNNAGAGNIGEYISSNVNSGSPVTDATGSTTAIVFINLTAGDWEVGGVVDYIPNAATSVTTLTQGAQVLNGCMTSPVLGGQDTFTLWETAANVIGASNPAWAIPTQRVLLATTTQVCLITKPTFTLNTLTSYGTIWARRMR